MIDYWMTAGLAVAISVVVSVVVTLWSGQRAIQQQIVFEDRRRWRDDLRTLIPKLLDPAQVDTRVVTRNEILLRLNPTEDREAMDLVDTFVSDPTAVAAEQVVGHFQRYLKFEWTRAKKEAGWWPFRAAQRARIVIAKQEQGHVVAPTQDNAEEPRE